MEPILNPEDLPPIGDWVAPDRPDPKETLARLQRGDFKDDLERLELLGALFSSDEEVDHFVAWVRRERRKHLA